MAIKYEGDLKFGRLILASGLDFDRMVGWVRGMPDVMMGYLNQCFLCCLGVSGARECGRLALL